ncbi:MAG: YggS family pyridoxal phosphate-dependent enzyme [Clostridia bacterium]|nr:YggS family pyridoxal phosphate-dependent enzyme [Clostridia bacterium]
MQERVASVRRRIAQAAQRAGRSETDITLIGVSKTKPAALVNEALACGITDIGENRVQELLEKLPALEGKPRVHLIGHLQTNKVKQVIGKTTLIHSVDSLKLAKEISRQSLEAGLVSDVLLQVNIGRDENKFGFLQEELPEALQEISPLAGIRVRGLMTVPPIEQDSAKTRAHFQSLYKVFIDIPQIYDNIKMEYLSMGMSGDFEIAVEEGANLVRVGSAVFGSRA